MGKSTLSQLLSDVWKNGSTVEVDRLRTMRNSVSWTDQAQHADDLRVAARHVHALLMLGLRPVLVVDAFNGTKPRWLLDELFSHGGSFAVARLYLYADAHILTARIKARPEGGFGDIPLCLTINSECASAAPQAHQIVVDTSTMTPTEVRDKILSFLSPP